MTKYLCLAAFLIGCGGSGVSDSKKLADLSVSEAKDVCLELADDYPEKTVNCSGTSITIGYTAADCETDDTTPSTCTATVGDIRDCADAIYSLSDAQFCMQETLPAACAPLEAEGC